MIAVAGKPRDDPAALLVGDLARSVALVSRADLQGCSAHQRRSLHQRQQAVWVNGERPATSR